jgi:hypothetical protein
MTQATTWGVPQAGPATPSAYVQRAQASLDALLSCHRGASRPSYAVAGTIWVQTIDGTKSEIYYFDGTTDIYMGWLDLTNHLFFPAPVVNRWSSRPSYVAAGATWVKTIDATKDEVYYYDGTSDIYMGWIDLTNHLFYPVPASVSVNNANGNPNISDSFLNTGSLTGDAWNSIGPTGSGADYIWNALDVVPSHADWVKIRAALRLNVYSGTAIYVGKYWYGRKNGSSEDPDEDINAILHEALLRDTISARGKDFINEFKIGLNSGMFDLYRQGTGTIGSFDGEMFLVEYGWNR